MHLNDIRRASFYAKIPFVQHLRQLGSKTRTASARSIFWVAERAVLGSVAGAEMDTMARLQVLEGACGKKPWEWSQNPRRGLKVARAHIEEIGATPDPQWLAWKDTGMVRIIEATAASFMAQKGSGLGLDAETLTLNLLMGMGSSGKRYAEPSLVGVGRYMADGILSGKENPQGVAKGPGSQQVRQRAIDEIRSYKRDVTRQGPQVRDDETTGQIEDPSQYNQPRFTQFLFDVMGQNNKAGRTLRELFRQSADSKPERQTIVNTMLDMVESGSYRDIEQVKNDLAAELGYTNSSTISAHLRRAIIPTFLNALKSNRIYRSLQEEYSLRHAR